MAYYHYVGHAPKSGVSKSGTTKKKGGAKTRLKNYCKDNPEELPHFEDAAAWDDPLVLEIDADTLTEARRVEDRHHRAMRFGEAFFGNKRHPADEAAYVPKGYAEATAMVTVGSHNVSKALGRHLGPKTKKATADTDVSAEIVTDVMEYVDVE